jgi:hypothetical protein
MLNDPVLLQELAQAGLISSPDQKGYFSFIGDSYITAEISTKISKEKRDMLKSLFSLSRNSVAILRQNQKLAAQGARLLEKAFTAKDIYYLVDNIGEIFFDLGLISQLLADRKKRGATPPKIHLIARKGAMENDVDTKTLRELIRTYFPDLFTGAAAVLIETDHNSSLLGHDLREFSPALLENMQKPGSMVLAKGLGNFITMQNAPFDIWYMFISKGFLGQRITEMLDIMPRDNAPVVLEYKAGTDIRPAYVERYLKEQDQ